MTVLCWNTTWISRVHSSDYNFFNFSLHLRIFFNRGFKNNNINNNKQTFDWLIDWFQVDFDIVRYDGSSGDVRVHYTTTPGTARPAPDPQALYVPVSGWLVFSDGGLGQQTVSVMLLDNGLLERPREFFLNVTYLELIEPRYTGLLPACNSQLLYLIIST